MKLWLVWIDDSFSLESQIDASEISEIELKLIDTDDSGTWKDALNKYSGFKGFSTGLPEDIEDAKKLALEEGWLFESKEHEPDGKEDDR